MKKLLIVSVLIAMTGISLYSCNNGPYDANPDVDLSGALNPLDPDSGSVPIYIGTMETVINSKKLYFSPAFYFIDTNGHYNLIARVLDDSVFRRTLRIKFEGYGGTGEYNVTSDTTNPIVDFTMVDTSRVDLAGRKIFKTYRANTGEGVGYFNIRIDGEEGGNLRGTLHGKLHRIAPEVMLDDTISIANSPFFFELVPFPVSGEYLDYIVY